MKLHFTLLILCVGFFASAADVIIPDANFLQAVDDAGYDTNNDDIIQDSEALLVTQLVLNSKGIADLTGIEAFTNVTHLYLYDNVLTGAIDLTALTSLATLQLSKNSLTSVDLTGLSLISDLRCSENNLASLDLSDQVALTYLSAEQNDFVSVDLRNSQLLESVYVDFSPNLQTLLVDGIGSLRVLSCKNGAISALDLSGLTSIEEIYCFGNNLTTLNASGLSTLKRLNANNNPITDANVSGLTSLWELGFLNNNLTTLDVRGLIGLPNTGIVRTDGNPNLVSVCVDNLSDPGTNWHKEPTAIYDDNCTISSVNELATDEAQVIAVYDITGNRVTEDTSGLLIIHYSNGKKRKEFRQ